MIRVCGPYEAETMLAVLAVLVVSTALAIWASIHLHQISDYVTFFDKTKTFMWVKKTEPVLHRSTIFALSADKDKANQLKEILETGISNGKISIRFQNEINRSRRGDTPLHVSTRANNVKGTEILLKAGAVPNENYENDLPQIRDHLQNSEILEKLQESKDKGKVPNLVLIALRRQLGGSELTDQQEKLLSLVGEGEYLAKQDVSLWDYASGDEPREVCVRAYQFVEVSNLDMYKIPR